MLDRPGGQEQGATGRTCHDNSIGKECGGSEPGDCVVSEECFRQVRRLADGGPGSFRMWCVSIGYEVDLQRRTAQSTLSVWPEGALACGRQAPDIPFSQEMEDNHVHSVHFLAIMLALGGPGVEVE